MVTEFIPCPYNSQAFSQPFSLPFLMWAIDFTHTSHSAAQTGIQQVCRSLAANLPLLLPTSFLVYDRFAKSWRPLDAAEKGILLANTSAAPPSKRSAQWTAKQKATGFLKRWSKPTDLPKFSGLLFPEIFDSLRFSQRESLCPVGVPTAAIFYDTIPLRFPKHTPSKTVERFPAYLTELSRFDLVIAISESSKIDLLNFWQSEGISQPPPVIAIPLGLPEDNLSNTSAPRVPVFPETFHCIMVGTLEARKNHLALLEAAEILWQEGLPFTLSFAGMLNKETGRPVVEKVTRLRRSDRPVQYLGPLSRSDLLDLYKGADCVVYPSLYEGFGLPVIEALAMGKPVISTKTGALGELVDQGGCLTCDTDPLSIASAMRQLFTSEKLFQRLCQEAAERPQRLMSDFSRDVSEALCNLTPKASA